MASCAVSSAGFLVLLATFPVPAVVYAVALGGPGVAVGVGAAALAGLEPFGVEAHLGWPFVGVGLLCFVGSMCAWSRLRLAISVIRCTAAFLRARPAVGLLPALFAMVHVVGSYFFAFFGGAPSSQNASPLVFIDESMPFDTVRMAGELTAQFAAGPSFKEGPLGFDGIGGVAIAVLDLPRTMVDLFMRLSSISACPRGFPAAASDGCFKMRKMKWDVQFWIRPLAGLLQDAGRFILEVVWFVDLSRLQCSLTRPPDKQAQEEVVQQAVPGGPRRRQRPPSCMRSFRNFAAEILEAVATWASKQAFVQVAISGCGFVPGATKAARLSASAPIGFLVVEGLANAFHRICELFLIGLAVVIASAWGCEGFKELLPPAAAAWLAAESLLHPYSVATTTILHCILMDTHTKQENDRAPSEANSLRAVMEQWDRDEDPGSFAQHYA
ncbi:hypothetical protein AK812_SmicGene35630 [Symbiodinium microadriaticum]|uniref:Choline transporter-like protein n=1 Tax=Symbiodinium microadriaticum TaxID=2951 RepID=A0A1Q9CL06_SYMMI|nr:hypothetical protein AK812_SmicGene35630 [Symbiodinium microadriaticum]